MSLGVPTYQKNEKVQGRARKRITKGQNNLSTKATETKNKEK